MKRLFIVLFMSALALVSTANSPVNFGLNFRLNMPRATFESTDWDNVLDDVNSATSFGELQEVEGVSDMGYAGGLFLRFNKGKGFLHSEAMFSMNSTGFNALDGSTLETINYTTEATTFNLPVYLGRNLVNSPAFKVRAFTGPQFAWVMNSSATITHEDGSKFDVEDSSVEFDSFTWLWSLGAGIEIFMFSLDARYGFDLKGIEGVNDLEQSFKQTTNMLEFTLGFKLF